MIYKKNTYIDYQNYKHFMILDQPCRVHYIYYLLYYNFLFSILLSVKLHKKSLSFETSKLFNIFDFDFIMNLFFINFLLD